MITTFQIPFMIWLQHAVLSVVSPSVIVFIARYIPWIFLGGLVVIIMVDMLRAVITRKYKMFQLSFWEIVFTFLIALIFQWVFKLLIPEPRPFLEGITPLYYYGWNESFPSGHTLIFTALAVMIHDRHKTIGVIAVIIAFLIGIARIVVGIHYPLDVAVGALLGLLIGHTVVRMVRRHYKK
jgi:undecaprenyl-diphosphatase